MVKKPWSSKELRYLRENAHKGAKVIAFDLSRTVKSIQRQAERQGISFADPPRNLCHKCHSRPIQKTSLKARDMGLCDVCFKEWQLQNERDKAYKLQLQMDIQVRKNYNTRLRKEIRELGDTPCA